MYIIPRLGKRLVPLMRYSWVRLPFSKFTKLTQFVSLAKAAYLSFLLFFNTKIAEHKISI